MTISLKIPDAVVDKLVQRAAASNQAVDDYALQVLTQAMTSPTIDELFAPVRQQAAESGLAEEELMELGRDALNAVRSKKRAKAS